MKKELQARAKVKGQGQKHDLISKTRSEVYAYQI